MPVEPSTVRAVAFVDGQNLFYAVKFAFGYTFPNYDVPALAQAVCAAQGWTLSETRFYTGIPSDQDDPFWNHFWSKKLAYMGSRGVYTFKRNLRYRNQTVNLPDGSTTTVLVGQEKGIDIRIALDMVHLAWEDAYDVAVVFSQDQGNSVECSVAGRRWFECCVHAGRIY
jgi:uncharacterized LabA/DUF88 family protein